MSTPTRPLVARVRRQFAPLHPRRVLLSRQIDGTDLDEDTIRDYFLANFEGDCLLAVGGPETIKIHFHTNEPWQLLEYASSLGEIYDIVVEDMERQAKGLPG